jgi:hypothetical protein
MQLMLLSFSYESLGEMPLKLHPVAPSGPADVCKLAAKAAFLSPRVEFLAEIDK